MTHADVPGPGPHCIESARAVLTPESRIELVPVTPTFYQDLDARFAAFAGHALVSRFTFSKPWDTWEIHPQGDELVYLLEGETDLILWRDGREEIVHISGSNGFVLVPKGTWHTARPRMTTSMLFVTFGEGTVNADHPS